MLLIISSVNVIAQGTETESQTEECKSVPKCLSEIKTILKTGTINSNINLRTIEEKLDSILLGSNDQLKAVFHSNKLAPNDSRIFSIRSRALVRVTWLNEVDDSDQFSTDDFNLILIWEDNRSTTKQDTLNPGISFNVTNTCTTFDNVVWSCDVFKDLPILSYDALFKTVPQKAEPKKEGIALKAHHIGKASKTSIRVDIVEFYK
jgi:hypothetical protein